MDLPKWELFKRVPMKIIQLIVFVLTLLVMVAYFIFTLSFSSAWAMGEDFLRDFYLEAQIANRLMYDWALYGVIFAGLSIVFQSHKLRRYTILNYVFALGTIFVMIQAAMFTSPICHNLNALFEQQNPLLVTLITAVNYTKNPTLMFEMGHIFTTLLWIQAIILIVFLIIRFFYRLNVAKTNKRLLAEN